MTTRLDFAHAILERRLTDGFVDVEYKKAKPFSKKTTITEPLHDGSAARIVEAVENIARTILYTSGHKRMTLVCSQLTISSTDIKLTIFELKDME